MTAFQPLGGVRVLELSGGWNGAATTGALLASLGAEVTRWAVEDDAVADAHFPAAARLHAGKHVADSPQRALDETWDVVVADGSADRALLGVGLDTDALRERAGVVAWVTPYGREHGSPHPASEFTLQADAGIVEVTGHPGGPGVRAGFTLGAVASACVTTTAIAAALAARARDLPHPRTIDVATLDVLYGFLATQLPGRWLGGSRATRQGNRHPMAAPWNAYECRDGWVVICTMSDRQWAAMCELLQRPDWAGDPELRAAGRRVARAQEIDADIGRWVAGCAAADVLETCARAGIAAGPVRGLAEAFDRSPLRCPVEDGVPAPGHFTPAGAGSAAGRHEPNRARGPLSGLRVVELGSYTSAPLASRLLSGLGAEVVKLEPPRGDPCRHLAASVAGTAYLFHLNNTDKRSVMLDVGEPGADARASALLGESDVFMSNLSSATLARCGFDAASVLGRAPHLLHCVITGFDRTSPDAGRPAFDTVIQGMCGMMELTGRPEDPPVRVGISAVDVLAALMSAAQIASWWRWRVCGGPGGALEVPLHDVGVWACCDSWDAPPNRQGNAHPGVLLQDVFPSRDGAVAVSVDGEDALAALRRRGIAGQDPRGDVAAWCAARGTDEAVAGLAEAGVACAPVSDLGRAADHPRARARQVLQAGAAGTSIPWLLGYPWWLDGRPGRIGRVAPGAPGCGDGAPWSSTDDFLDAAAR